ncbi:MAG: hypothetical protein AB1918_06375, partial [Pseudomonadota bacterium]
GPKACEAIGHTMVGHFATRLETEARKAGGALSADQIRALADRFLAEEHGRFGTVFRRSYDTCTATREAGKWESARRRPFDRMLMKTFAPLFPPRQGDDGGQGVLSRRMIPGFNLAIDKMIGPMLYEQCQRKSQGILDRHRMANGAYDWEAVHADPEARALINDVLVAVAHYFGNFHRRRDWFMDLVNSHLAPAQPGAADEHWQLTNYGFAELMHALFTDLRTRLRADPKGMAKRYGEHTAEALEGFFRRLDGG